MKSQHTKTYETVKAVLGWKHIVTNTYILKKKEKDNFHIENLALYFKEQTKFKAKKKTKERINKTKT